METMTKISLFMLAWFIYVWLTTDSTEIVNTITDAPEVEWDFH